MTANREPRHRKRWEEVPPDPGIIPGGIRDRAMRAVQRISSLKRTKYGAIYADPPWSFRNWSAKGTGRNAISHYDCLDFSALATLPVSDLAADDRALFLWTTDFTHGASNTKPSPSIG